MKPIYIDDGKTRQQKNTLLLLDVRYRIYAKLVFIPVKDRPKEAFAKHQPSADENPMKYYQMFERRASQGQCFTQPYLCLLYTSDAADEEDSVDFGGRRTIKKKKNRITIIHISETKR